MSRMMKKAWMVGLGLTMAGLSSCEMESSVFTPEMANPNQEVLYYGRYSNFAWTAQDVGFYVDRGGKVYTFDLEGDFDRWQMPTDDVYAPGILEDNFSQNSDYQFTLESDWLSRHTEVLQEVSERLLSAPASAGADRGALSVYVLELDDTNSYHQHLVKTEGDWEQAREGRLASQVSDWLFAVYSDVSGG